MDVIEQVLGNQHDAEWHEKLHHAHIDLLHLDQWEAQKNRFRKKSEGGVEVAVALDRGKFLRDGDILKFDGQRAVVARIALKEVLLVKLDGLLDQDPATLLRTAVELGHALGNQHWPAVVKDTRVYVPMAVDRQVMASVMKTHALPGITWEFVQGAEVIPYLAPHEARRLFGGAEHELGHHHH